MTRNSVFNIQNKEVLENKRKELIDLFEEVESQNEEEVLLEKPDINGRLSSLKDFDDSFKGLFNTRENIAHASVRKMIDENQTVSTFVGNLIKEYIDSEEYDDSWEVLHSFRQNLASFESDFDFHKNNLTNRIESSIGKIGRLPEAKEDDGDEFDFI